MTTLARARALGAAGFFVFPLNRGTKTPMHTGWQAEATRTPSTWPEGANIGIFCERFGDDQALLAVDVDTRPGKDGESSIRQLGLGDVELPPTFEQRTPSGGRHLIYVVDRPVAPSAGKIGRGIDIRSAGSYVAGPGSVLENGTYTASNRIRPTGASTWLIEHAGARKERDPQSCEPLPGIDAERALRRFREYLTVAPTSVQGEAGDITAFRVAARGKEFGVGHDETLLAMLDGWDDRCSPPWGAEELATKVDNAFRYSLERQGSAAPEIAFNDEFTEALKAAAAELKPQPRGAIDLIRAWVPHAFESVNKPVRFVVDGVIQRGHAGALVAAGGTSKTSLMLYLACCIAIGREFGGHQIPDVGRTLLLSLDDPQEDLDGALAHTVEGFCPDERARIRELVQVVSLRGVPGGALIEQSGNEYGPTKFAAELIAHLRTVDDLRLVVLDTLGQFSGADSSDEAAMKSILRVAGSVAEVPAKPACAFLHHVAKEVARNKVVDQYSARGSAAITDNARFALHLSLLDPEDRQQLRLADAFEHLGSDVLMVTPTRGSLLVKKAEPFYLRRHGFRFETLHARPKSAEERLGELDQRVLDWVASENRRGVRPTMALVKQGIGKRADDIREAVDRLVRAGRVTGRGTRKSELLAIDGHGSANG